MVPNEFKQKVTVSYEFTHKKSFTMTDTGNDVSIF